MQQCIICEEEKDQGIRLCKTFICTECEYNMIHTDVREIKYRYYIRKLKNMTENPLLLT